MKKLLFLFFMAVSIAGYSQTQDLVALAQGDFLGMNALFDEHEQLFGYISLYDHGKATDSTKKFEYVLLDKNLNPFANNTFEGDITAGDFYGYINFDGHIVLRPTSIDASFVRQKELYTPSAMIINIEDNSIKRKIFYEYDHGSFKAVKQQDTWKENQKENREEWKKLGYVYKSGVSEIKEGGYIVNEYEDHGTYIKNNHLIRYDENKKKLWEYSYNTNSSQNEWQAVYYLDKNEQYYYGLLRNITGRDETYSLLVIDMGTGKEVHKKEIKDPDKVIPMIRSYPTYGRGNIDNDKSFDDKIVMVGRRSEGMYNTGVARLLIDKKTFYVDLKVLTYLHDFKVHIPEINVNGYVGNRYFLDPRDVFFMKDGSIGMLYEKYKARSDYTPEKTTDMVYVAFDKNFKITGVTVLEKERSKIYNADYLFSQELNNGDDLVFFYRDLQKDDKTKEKNWNLFINTFIDGKFKQDMVPISSRKNFLIVPYIAKEGYILLHEYNKEAKYNQVRLERLNY